MSYSPNEILRIARRETSVEHCQEFDPIVKGAAFALLALIPLCVFAAAYLLCQTVIKAAKQLYIAMFVPGRR